MRPLPGNSDLNFEAAAKQLKYKYFKISKTFTTFEIGIKVIFFNKR